MKALSLTGMLKRALNLHASLLQDCKKTLFLFALTAITSSVTAQYLPGTPARFNIDGQLSSTATTHDWFQTATGTSLGIFDTVDALKIRQQIATGKNMLTSRKMKYGAYTIHDGFLMLDGTYSRDYFGNDTTLDRTIFSTDGKTASQNAQDPTEWVVADKGSVLPSKSDIIDSYIHMRRDGTSIEPGKASPLYVYFGASTLSAAGDHHIDFELFKTAVRLSGKGFSSTSVSTTTGGRDPWLFTNDGSISSFGGMAFSISFNSTAISDIGIYIWVSYDAFTKVNPKNFDFDQDDWNGVRGGFGYARIKPNPGEALPIWGTINTETSAAPLWGTNSKELGSQTTNYYHTQYSIGQFAEAAINLSALGVDPALSVDFDKCTPPYKRVLMKTRSSSSFSSALQDFAGPFEFLDAPTAPADIQVPAALTCSLSQLTLQPLSNITGASYKWTTDDGFIVSGANTATPVINKPGKYELVASLYEGCAATKSSVKVQQDIYQPVAIATAQGLLTSAPDSKVIIEGGNTDSSNYATEFGGSQGLLWNWSGPNFTAITQHVSVTEEGEYQLIVTEKRNGCTDTAFARVARIEGTILPVAFTQFSAHAADAQVLLNWGLASNESGSHILLQKSTDGQNFETFAALFNTDKQGAENYQYKDKWQGATVYYRLKSVNKNQTHVYSNIIAVSKNNTGNNQLQLLQNPVNNSLTFRYTALEDGTADVVVYTIAGGRILGQKINVRKGQNTVSIPLNNSFTTGSYIVEVWNGNTKSTVKFIKF